MVAITSTSQEAFRQGVLEGRQQQREAHRNDQRLMRQGRFGPE
jgi:hypothetical protein